MPIDTSIYANIQPVQTPNVLDAGIKAATLGDLSMKNQQMQTDMQTQQAMKAAYANNTDASGNLNQQGFLSDLGKVSPMAAMQYGQQMNAMQKSQAETQAAKMDALEKVHAAAMPGFNYLGSMSPEDRAKAYPQVRQSWQDAGLPVQHTPPPDQFDDKGWFQPAYAQIQQSVAGLAAQKSQSEIAKNMSEVATAPAKLNSELYGSRSPNAELSSQYDKQAQPVRSSQVAMQQMLDNYNHPTPQGDASLILNAYKIKFPGAPDVNSLDELSKSQSAPDKFKNAAAAALAGGVDQPTRDNLMRDGISTYRANVNSLQGVQQRYQARAKAQNVTDQTLTYEPAINKTFSDAMDLQKGLGPYVPPSDRGGFMAGLSKMASNVLGTGSPSTANAGNSAPKMPPPPDGFVRMQAPGGGIKLVPASQRGAAIAAGGKVIQ